MSVSGFLRRNVKLGMIVASLESAIGSAVRAKREPCGRIRWLESGCREAMLRTSQITVLPKAASANILLSGLKPRLWIGPMPPGSRRTDLFVRRNIPHKITMPSTLL